MEPVRPEERIDPEIDRAVRERLAAFNEDKKTAQPARVVVDDIRRKLSKHLLSLIHI